MNDQELDGRRVRVDTVLLAVSCSYSLFRSTWPTLSPPVVDTEVADTVPAVGLRRNESESVLTLQTVADKVASEEATVVAKVVTVADKVATVVDKEATAAVDTAARAVTVASKATVVAKEATVVPKVATVAPRAATAVDVSVPRGSCVTC